MSAAILTLDRLSHRYNYRWAVRDINLEIRQHGIVGLLGANGAGKSTTMNIICGVLNQTEGAVRICGIDLRSRPEDAKRLLGFLPQQPPLYPDFTVLEYLVYSAHLRRVPKKQIPKAVAEAMAKCGLSHMERRLIRNLSGGYRQRVGIAQAIIHRPSLVVLDEPTNGLDPNQVTEVRQLIREIASDRAVIFSSHMLAEVQALCKDICMIAEGHVVFSDTITAFNNYLAPTSLTAHFARPPTAESLLAIPGIQRVESLTETGWRLHFSGPTNIAERVIAASVAGAWRLQEITIDKNSLDTVFAQLSKKPN